MQVLLIGGAGYIGSHIIDLFLKNNIEIIVLDNLINSDLNQIKSFNIKTYIGDYGNNKILKQIFKENNIEAVIHLGGLISVSESVKHPINYYFNNLYKSHILINQCKKTNIKYFLFASSASVYGKYNKIEPLTEDSIKKPNSPYGQTKLFTEKLLEKSGLCYGILRYFNVAGASNNIKECHKNHRKHII